MRARLWRRGDSPAGCDEDVGSISTSWYVFAINSIIEGCSTGMLYHVHVVLLYNDQLL